MVLPNTPVSSFDLALWQALLRSLPAFGAPGLGNLSFATDAAPATSGGTVVSTTVRFSGEALLSAIQALASELRAGSGPAGSGTTPGWLTSFFGLAAYLSSVVTGGLPVVALPPPSAQLPFR